MNRRGPLIAAGVAGAVALIMVFLLVLPEMGKVSSTQDDLTKAQDQEVALQAQLRALQQAQAEAPQTQKQIEKLRNEVPPTADLPGLFRLLQGAADTAAVDFFSFTPGTPAPDSTTSFSIMSGSINVTGTYFSIDEFLFKLESLSRAAKVTSIALTPSGTSTGTTTTTTSAGELSAVLTVEFYTTDTSAGPGSIPGPSEDVNAEQVPLPGASPTPSPTPGA